MDVNTQLHGETVQALQTNRYRKCGYKNRQCGYKNRQCRKKKTGSAGSKGRYLAGRPALLVGGWPHLCRKTPSVWRLDTF